MANIFGTGGPLGPIAPGLSGAVNPLVFLGSGMATGNIGAAMGQMANIQQAAQQLSLNRQQLAQDAVNQRASNIIAQQRLAHQMSKPTGTSLQQNLNWAMGLPEGDPRRVAALEAIRRGGGTTVNVGGAGEFGPVPTAMARVEDPASPTGSRLVEEPGAPAAARREAEQKKQLAPIESMESSLDAYEALIDEHGPEILPGNAKYALGGAYTALLLEAKELARLGALSGDDLRLMEAMFEDPTSIRAQAMGAEGLKAQLEVVRNRIKAAKQRVTGEAPTQAPLPPGFVEE